MVKGSLNVAPAGACDQHVCDRAGGCGETALAIDERTVGRAGRQPGMTPYHRDP